MLNDLFEVSVSVKPIQEISQHLMTELKLLLHAEKIATHE